MVISSYIHCIHQLHPKAVSSKHASDHVARRHEIGGRLS